MMRAPQQGENDRREAQQSVPLWTLEADHKHPIAVKCSMLVREAYQLCAAFQQPTDQPVVLCHQVASAF